MRQTWRDLADWPARRWIAALLAMVGVAAVMAIPTALITNPLYTRMTAVTWWSWPVWVTTAGLTGLVLATYVRTPGGATRTAGATASGGLLSVLAVGCPVCNKIVVAVVGVSGALRMWAPLQPLLALASIGLLGWALRTRLLGERACRLRPARPPAS